MMHQRFHCSRKSIDSTIEGKDIWCIVFGCMYMIRYDMYVKVVTWTWTCTASIL